MYFIYFWCIFHRFFPMENLFYLLFLLLLLCRRGNDHFDVSFWWIKLVPFPSKDGKDAVYEGRNGGRGVYFLPESAVFLYFFKTVFPYLYPELECKQICFPPTKGYKQEKRKYHFYYLILQSLVLYWISWIR